jgi:hypothetical protein
LLESDKGSYEVCSEFFKDSPMLEDKSKIAAIAVKARMFARGRKNEISITKYLLFGHFPVLGGILSAAAAIMDIPAMHLGWVPHAVMTFFISVLAMGSQHRTYASRFPPIFKAEDKLIREVQAYLEYREFAEYRLSLGGNQVEAKILKAQEA